MLSGVIIGALQRNSMWTRPLAFCDREWKALLGEKKMVFLPPKPTATTNSQTNKSKFCEFRHEENICLEHEPRLPQPTGNGKRNSHSNTIRLWGNKKRVKALSYLDLRASSLENAIFFCHPCPLTIRLRYRVSLFIYGWLFSYCTRQHGGNIFRSEAGWMMLGSATCIGADRENLKVEFSQEIASKVFILFWLFLSFFLETKERIEIYLISKALKS